MSEIKISVIIPFYNAREFIIQAVESALMQPETDEVLIIEDGSPDGGLEICKFLSEKYPSVRLLQHADNKNHGAAASRNLGIENASNEYIAFLDADDYYLPDRFKKAIEILSASYKVEGVYEAVGSSFEDSQVRDLFLNLKFKELTTVKKVINPDDLFKEIILGNIGYFSLDGLTINKHVFLKTGYFSELLEVYEDTDMIYKLCALSHLYPGSIEKPVAVRRVHYNNRITYFQSDKVNSYKQTVLLYKSLMDWAEEHKLSREHKKTLLHRYIIEIRKSDMQKKGRVINFVKSRYKIIRLGIEFPFLLTEKFIWRLLVPSRSLLSNFFLVTMV